MYYGNYNEDGVYIGFYTPEVHCKLKPIYNTEPILETVMEKNDETGKEVPKEIIKEIGTVIMREEYDLSTIPTPNIKLTTEEWQEALTGEYKVVKGVHTHCPPAPPTTEEVMQQQLVGLDSEFQPQFLELAQALGVASLTDNSVLIANIKSDYAELKAEYDERRGAIVSG